MTLMFQGQVKSKNARSNKQNCFTFVIISPKFVINCPVDCFMILQVIYMYSGETNKAERPTGHRRVYV